MQNTNSKDVDFKDLKIYKVNVDFGDVDVFAVGIDKEEAKRKCMESIDDIQDMAQLGMPILSLRKIERIDEISQDWVDEFPFGCDLMTIRDLLSIAEEERKKKESLAEFDRLQTNFDFFDKAGIKL